MTRWHDLDAGPILRSATDTVLWRDIDPLTTWMDLGDRPQGEGAALDRGRLVAVVGPSGVGKDSLIDALTERLPSLHRVRRTITRPPGPGERFDSVTPAAFARLREAGAFCLHWDAHGLSYGIPTTTAEVVAAGGEAIANLSRAVLPRAAVIIPRLVVLHLTATPQTLAARLGRRGREGAAAIAERLDRAGAGLPEGLGSPVIAISNDGPFEDTVAAATAALYGAGAP
jgi:ribose 1,5-bisphosphokinase